jgi:hypothetical protein
MTKDTFEASLLRICETQRARLRATSVTPYYKTMKNYEWTKPSSGRRRFLAAAVRLTAASVAVGVFAGCGKRDVGSDSATATSRYLDTETRTVLNQMINDLFPGPGMTDQHYVGVVDHFETLASDGGTRALLVGGASALAKDGWPDLAENERIASLRSQENSAFFQTVRFFAQGALYGNPAIGLLYGYEGESFSKGGYINRGFDDIDWLGDAP